LRSRLTYKALYRGPDILDLRYDSSVKRLKNCASKKRLKKTVLTSKNYIFPFEYVYRMQEATTFSSFLLLLLNNKVSILVLYPLITLIALLI
jgi:hypothetical protein